MPSLPTYLLWTSIDYGHEYYTAEYRDVFFANNDAQAKDLASKIRDEHHKKYFIEMHGSTLYEVSRRSDLRVVEHVKWHDVQSARVAIPATSAQAAGFYPTLN